MMFRRYEPGSQASHVAERAVFTLAVGRPVFLDMAITLGRSLRYWNPHLRFAIATDAPARVPRDLLDSGVEIIALKPGEYGQGFSPKLHLDRLAPAEHSLFVDADSLVTGSLDTVFERFAGNAVSVIGGTIAEGEWFGDVASVCRRLGLQCIPKFNGGIYYLERGERCTAIYDRARALEPEYDALGLTRMRGGANDELLMALAMALNDQWGVAEDGSIMAEPLNFASGTSIDVLAGRATLRNTPGHPQYRPQWPLSVAHPLIVHFLGGMTDRAPYTTEALRLRKVMVDGWSPWMATLLASLVHEIPQATTDAAKSALRPVYRALFGVRPIPVSNRI